MTKEETKNNHGTYINLKQAAGEINASISTTRKLADKAGAVVHIGRCYRINREMFLEYVNSQLAQN